MSIEKSLSRREGITQSEVRRVRRRKLNAPEINRPNDARVSVAPICARTAKRTRAAVMEKRTWPEYTCERVHLNFEKLTVDWIVVFQDWSGGREMVERCGEDKCFCFKLIG